MLLLTREILQVWQMGCDHSTLHTFEDSLAIAYTAGYSLITGTHYWILHTYIPGHSMLRRSPELHYLQQTACELPRLHSKHISTAHNAVYFTYQDLTSQKIFSYVLKIRKLFCKTF